MAASSSNIWWIGPLVLVLIRIIVLEARLSRASRKRQALVFPLALSFRIGLWSAIALFTFLILRELHTEEPWLLWMGAALAICLSMALGYSFVCTETNVTRKLWWLRDSTIAWTDGVDFEHTAGGDFNVYGKYGQRLCFSRFHVAPGAFEAEVRRRAPFAKSSAYFDPISIR
jgi:hypothetical protein